MTDNHWDAVSDEEDVVKEASSDYSATLRSSSSAAIPPQQQQSQKQPAQGGTPAGDGAMGSRDRSMTMGQQPASNGNSFKDRDRSMTMGPTKQNAGGPAGQQQQQQQFSGAKTAGAQQPTAMPAPDSRDEILLTPSVHSEDEALEPAPVEVEVAPTYSTALPLNILGVFGTMIAGATKPDKDENLSGSAVHDRDGLIITRCGDCDPSLVGKTTILLRGSMGFREKGKFNTAVEIVIETDRRTITCGTLSSTAGDPFLLTTLHTAPTA
jgi:hypothetical protein